MRLITIAEFLSLYENGFLSEVVTVKNNVYARNVKGQAGNPRRSEIVFAEVP